eukprot:TRINITY_DN16641_c0_g1_i1.p3 TRINITY_DN16641_c0_g1~~TRINITY_DN16641_c0_g1_i1.p3  ORF type:complete len:188 (+),score=68.19 TRINITY_DN16641_c0_g1_i1:167-730(+)
MRHFGTPISGGVLLLLDDRRHPPLRRAVAPLLAAPATADAVAAAIAAAFADGGAWAASFDAAAAAGEAIAIDEALMDVTLDVIHTLIFSAPWPPGARCAARAHLADFFALLAAIGPLPAAEVTAPAAVAALRRLGDWFCGLVRTAEADRRAAVAAGTWGGTSLTCCSPNSTPRRGRTRGIGGAWRGM